MAMSCDSGLRTRHVEVRDTGGALQKPLVGVDVPFVVIVFASPDCPIANAIAPEIERLHKMTVDAGAAFYLVHARSDVTADTAQKHARKFAITAPILLDTDQSLAKELNATVTPEIVVVKTDQPTVEIIYQGLINNLYASLGNRRDQASEHYAREAIASAIDGIAVDPAYRKPLGCFIERAEP